MTTATTTFTVTPPPPPPQEAEAEAAPEDILQYIIENLLPFLLLSTLSVGSFTNKWRCIRSKINQLNSSLSSISAASYSFSHPLFPLLLPPLLSTLVSLRSIFHRCNDLEITGGKLLLQSDLDIASSSLDHHLHDLHLLLPFLLSPPPPPSSSSTTSSTSVGNAIVLSHPTTSSSKDDISVFVRDLFARLAIGGLELKVKALDSLLRLIREGCGSIAADVVTEEGGISCILRLLDSSTYQSVGIREQAVSAVAALVSTSELSRKVIFEEGGLGPLIRLLDSGSIVSREQAADAIETITSDPNNAWAVAAYGGIAVLIDSCRPCNGSSPLTRKKASGSLRNVIAASVGGEIKESMVEEGVIPLIVEMLGDDESEIRKNAVHSIWMLGSGGESVRVSILQEGALSKLLHLFRECLGVVLGNLETMEHVLRALHVLSSSSSAAKTLSGSSIFLSQLADLIVHNYCQREAVALLCNLSLNEEGKRVMAGCMGALVKMMMDSPKPLGSQEMAAQALILLLSVRSNRKDLSRDEKSITRLVQMLDPKSSDGVCKKLPVSVVLSMLTSSGGTSGSCGCRKMILAAGACQHLQKLAELDVPGAKKALQRISGGRLKKLFSSISWRE